MNDSPCTGLEVGELSTVAQYLGLVTLFWWILRLEVLVQSHAQIVARKALSV